MQRLPLVVCCLALVSCAGQTGPQGKQGEPGADGRDGTNGVDGRDGMNGVDGTNGSNGTNGTTGSNGENGRPALVRTRSEPAGTHCAAGGVAILSGVDSNADGTLQDAEVTATSYVCGSPAQLVRTDVEPRGATCAEGGVVINTGLDTNGNGTLDDAEVQTRQTLCGMDASGEDVIGDVGISNSLEYARYKNVTSISGLLAVTNPRLSTTVLEFPRLRTVGALNLGSLPTTTRVSFPALTSITSTGTDATVGPMPVLTTLEFPALTRAARSFVITNNPALVTVSLPALTTVAVGLTLSTNGASARAPLTVTMPQLLSTGSLTITGNPFLVECPLRRLRPAVTQRGYGLGPVTFSGNGTQLASLDAGLDAGCSTLDGCWLASPSSPFKLLPDGGAKTPDWALDGGVQGASYLLCDGAYDFEAAVSECARVTDGGRMVLPDAPSKNAWLQTRLEQMGYTSGVWAGARDRFLDGGLPNPDGGWTWLTGAAMTYSNFGAGEPNGGNTENCLESLPNGLWNDAQCTSTRSLACELP